MFTNHDINATGDSNERNSFKKASQERINQIKAGADIMAKKVDALSTPVLESKSRSSSRNPRLNHEFESTSKISDGSSKGISGSRTRTFREGRNLNPFVPSDRRPDSQERPKWSNGPFAKKRKNYSSVKHQT